MKVIPGYNYVTTQIQGEVITAKYIVILKIQVRVFNVFLDAYCLQGILSMNIMVV